MGTAENTNKDAEKLTIAEPCHMRWDELKAAKSGEAAKRWCDQCTLHVIDGPSLTQQEAEELVASSNERVCMRIVHDEHGEPVHAKAKPRAVDRLLRYGITAAAGLLAACGDDRSSDVGPDPTGGGDPDASTAHDPTGGERPLPPEILGAVCYPADQVDPPAEEHSALIGKATLDPDGEPTEPSPPRSEVVGRIAPMERMGEVVCESEPARRADEEK